MTRAADLLLSSRVVLAEEAEQLGLVNRALPPDDLLPYTYSYAGALAAEIAPSSLAATKLQLYRDLHGDVGVVGPRRRVAHGRHDARRRLRRGGGGADREAPAGLSATALGLSRDRPSAVDAGGQLGRVPAEEATAWRKAKRSVIPAT